MEKLRMQGYKKIYYLDCFPEEFLKATNYEDRYRKWLDRVLYVLEEKGTGAIILEQFEKLKSGAIPLYSIRYPKSTLNPRVIYFFIEDDNVVLVTAFKEKSSSDYTRAIQKASDRYAFITQGGLKNGG